MIGVCIKYFYPNYGGMLQAYATTKILEKRGISYELIYYEKKYTLLSCIHSIPRIFNHILLNDKFEMLKKRLGYKMNPSFESKEILRKAAFAAFCEEKFKKKEVIYKGYKNLCKGSQRYTAVMTGSDQLWSPAGLPTNFYNLEFVPDKVRKISYASSFGVSNIPWYQRSRTKHFLERIDFISMRENRGAEIVETLTGKKVPVLLDPVFMISTEEWDTLIGEVDLEISTPYIFAYFLGDNPAYRQHVIDFSRKYNLKIVALKHIDQYIKADEYFGDVSKFDIGPKEFLAFLRNATYVCTDSFHGMAFSIIYKRQFVIFNRYNEYSLISKNSRIDSLCSNLELTDRRFTSNLDVLSEPIKYEVVNNHLNKLKNKTNQYLDIALK